jgi:uncharacterized membrane protein HdeD (DUF308 family)
MKTDRELETHAQKYAAERAARHVRSAKAVANELVVKPPDDSPQSDADIAMAAVEALETNPLVPSQRIRVMVRIGWVKLEGEVNWPFQRNAAERAVRRVAGLTGLSNLIVVSRPAWCRRHGLLDEQLLDEQKEESMNQQPDELESLAHSLWWSIALRGLLAIVFGVIALVNPRGTAEALILLFGVWSLLDAAFAFVAAARRAQAHLRWGWVLSEGMVGVAAGIIAFVYPGITMLAVVIFVAVRAILLGILQIGGAIAWQRSQWRSLHALIGVVSVLFGAMLLWQPGLGALALIWSIGVYAIIFGAMTLALALYVYGALRRLPRMHVPA